MAQPSYAPVPNPVSVIGSQFMAPYPLDVIVHTNSKGNLVITDINHKIMLKVKPCDTSYHRRRLLLDAYDRTIVMLRDKVMSNSRWKVFRGDSKSNSNMIFSAKTAHVIQFRTNVHVFLANKSNKKDVCDFKIEGSWSKRNCTISMGDSSTTIAQMHKMQPFENAKFIEDKFMVTISPNVDYAFVVALIAIVDAMKNPNTNQVAVDATGGVTLAFGL